MPDLLRTEANERVDLGDWQYATVGALDRVGRHTVEQMLTNPVGATRSWILEGFRMSNPAAQQIQVDRGVAILAYREGGVTNFGAVTAEGDVNKIVDIASFANATYGIFIRFEYVDGDSQNRIFWNPSGLGSEFAQTIPTRRKANWSVRIELTSPGGEWTKIGEVVKSGGPPAITDMRKLYFEGAVNASYQSGWSTDGGGVANDRSADRQLNGTRDFQTFTAAMRQTIEDIKGRGLRRWWDRDIGGMNIGFDANPTEDRLALGDAAMHLQWHSITPYLRFDDLGGNSQIVYHRGSDHFEFDINGVAEMFLRTTGVDIADGLNVGFLGSPITADQVKIGDVDFALSFNGGIPAMFGNVATNDHLRFFRDPTVANRAWQFMINNTLELAIKSTGIQVFDGANIGVSITDPPVADRLMVGDTSFYLDLGTANPIFFFDTTGGNDFISYTRSTNIYDFQIGGVSQLQLSAGILRPGANGGGDLGSTSVRWNEVFSQFLDNNTQTATTNAVVASSKFTAESTGDMTTGFGGRHSFVVRDTAAVDNELWRFEWKRDTGDARADIRQIVRNDGTDYVKYWVNQTSTIIGNNINTALDWTSPEGPFVGNDRLVIAQGALSQSQIDNTWEAAGILLIHGHSLVFSGGTYAGFFATANNGNSGFGIHDNLVNNDISIHSPNGTGSTNRKALFDDSNDCWYFGTTTTSALAKTNAVASGAFGPALSAYRSTATAADNVFVVYSAVGGAESLKLFIQADGDVFNVNGTYGTISDERAKETMIYFGDKGGTLPDLSTIFEKIRPIEYRLSEKFHNGSDPLRLGFKAGEVEAILPRLIQQPTEKGGFGMRAVNTVGMIPLLWEAVRQVMKRLDALEA